MKLNKIALLFVFFSGLALAQPTIKADIEGVSKDGLHRLMLAPDIRSAAKKDFGDIRIFDSNGVQVPYNIIVALRSNPEIRYEAFPILSETVVPKKNTSVIIENKKGKIDHIVLQIASTTETKTYSISGSDNKEQWFGLVNHQWLTAVDGGKNMSKRETMNFPFCNYRYLKVTFDDKHTLPVHVLKAGTTEQESSTESFEEVRPQSMEITQLPKEKKTRISLHFSSAVTIDKTLFEIASPKLYQREVRAYSIQKQKIRKRIHEYEEEIGRSMLASDGPNALNTPQALWPEEVFIEIDNRDNPPLEISKIRFYQHPAYVVADFKAGEKYTLQTGNPEWNKPDYDFPAFNTNVIDTLPLAKITGMQNLLVAKTPAEKSFWQQSWFMWLCIALGASAVAYFTASLLKDMK